MNTYIYKVKMSCYGCVNAVIKSLSDYGIKNVNVKFEEQLVYVTSDKTCNEVLELLISTGKNVIVM